MTALAVFAASIAAAVFGAYPVALAGCILGVLLLGGDRVKAAANADDETQSAGCSGLAYWLAAGIIGAVVLVLAAMATIAGAN